MLHSPCGVLPSSLLGMWLGSCSIIPEGLAIPMPLVLDFSKALTLELGVVFGVPIVGLIMEIFLHF